MANVHVMKWLIDGDSLECIIKMMNWYFPWAQWVTISVDNDSEW